MINVIEYLVSKEVVGERNGVWRLQVELDEVELDVPENIRNLIEKHIERLTPEEQRVLEGASVVGMDCSAVAISAGLAEDVLRIEEVCDELARSHQFLLPAYLAKLPDGTLTPRYRFIESGRLPLNSRSISNRRVMPLEALNICRWPPRTLRVARPIMKRKRWRAGRLS